MLETDRYTKFPMTLLVEKGKHALATDKNADGYFTKGFDVNERVNDAWGVRDILRTGLLFSGGYESYMTKIRHPEDQILPPLPDDSPLRPVLARRAKRQALAVYELRPFPGLEAAHGDPAAHQADARQGPCGPRCRYDSRRQAARKLPPGRGGSQIPEHRLSRRPAAWLLVCVSVLDRFKHLQDPMTGGYIVQHMYFVDHLRDFGWMAMYTPSASRWLDTYLSAGAEKDVRDSVGTTTKHWDFVFETGLKFRVNVDETPFKFLGHLTPYWGLRMGIQNRGFFEINRLCYVIEFGAGSF